MTEFTTECLVIENEVLAAIVCAALEFLSYPDFGYGLTAEAVDVLVQILRGEDDDEGDTA